MLFTKFFFTSQTEEWYAKLRIACIDIAKGEAFFYVVAEFVSVYHAQAIHNSITKI